MTTVWILDIDTTLADNTHRHELLQKQCRICLSPVPGKHRSTCDNCGSSEIHTPQAGWDAFTDPVHVLNDKPVEAAQRAVDHFRKLGIEHHYLTGRSDSAKDATQEWLTNHFGFDPGVSKLMMRSKHHRGVAASDYKEMQFLAFKANYPVGTQFIFAEDDQYVFTMYSKYGVVLRCPEAWEHLFPKGNNRQLEPKWNL